MLNISKNSILDQINLEEYNSFKQVRKSRVKRLNLIMTGSLLIGLCLIMFLPWTQNITAKGFVTTRLPEQRPQAIHSVIAGRLEKWHVREGDFVNKGDTIVYISEVKSEYFDPDLIQRTTEQILAKQKSVTAYQQKVQALESQYQALEESLKLKRKQIKNKIVQAKNKIKIDSIDLIAFQTNLEIAENQVKRIQELYNKGLKSLTDLQEKKLKVQTLSAKTNVQQNKLQNQKNQLANLNLELLLIEEQFEDKLSKSRSERQSALSAKLENVATIAKLKNKLSNFSERQKLYYVTAPQSGYITKAISKGVGETIKEGTDIALIMPYNYDLAVEVNLAPEDLPLVDIGNRVRLRFDGWPAIVISGWPEASTGVFTGEIVAIDRQINESGYYSVLISPKKNEKAWPKKLRVGTGVRSFILLKNVPIWYEIWRKLNGFPADYYQKDNKRKKKSKTKKPIKSIK